MFSFSQIHSYTQYQESVISLILLNMSKIL